MNLLFLNISLIPFCTYRYKRSEVTDVKELAQGILCNKSTLATSQFNALVHMHNYKKGK